MTKDRLQGIVKGNTKHPVCTMTVLDAVEKYTAAQIAQSQCSTLREELHTIANRLLYSYPSLMDEVACKETDKKIEAINLVMELIDVRQPVA